MRLQLQFGYGMMEHCRHLIEEWNGGTAILSPRDLTEKQLIRLATTLTGLPNGKILVDPQFYLPHADHTRLCQHRYWPQNFETGAFWQGPALGELINKLNLLNLSLSSDAFILPGIIAAAIDADWIESQNAVLAEASGLETDLPLYLTIALSGDAARNNEQVALLMEAAERWTADGYYLVFEHPKGDYLVDDSNWLANVLDIAAGLKLRGSKVIMGYCNHQMLIAACAKVDAICSGTWMNVRSFPPDKFRMAYDEEIKQRATWYYCPQALSEYKIPTLDLAQRQRILPQLRPQAPYDNGYITSLFNGAQPSSVGFTEQAAFRHYLHCLRLQSESAQLQTFDETVDSYTRNLNAAETLLRNFATAGILGQQRDFRNIIDVNRGALSAFVATRGAVMRRRWSSL